MNSDDRFETKAGTSRRPAFFGGLLLGLILGLGSAGTVAVAADETLSNFSRSLLYAISELAVDTEVNAARIVALSGRIDELEISLKEAKGDKD